jgi:hypothetical protein
MYPVPSTLEAPELARFHGHALASGALVLGGNVATWPAVRAAFGV